VLNRWSTIVVLLLLVGITSWLLIRLDKDNRITKAIGRHEPDSYMENFTRTEMDENGRLKSRLQANYMVHFSDDDSTELVRPRLEIYSGDTKPWQITAERGWVNANHEVILLYGEVYLWRNNSKEERELEMITTDLRVLPKTEYAETDNATTIITPLSITNAIGMRLDLGTDRLELLSRVRSRHEVKSDR
jgi:lipopolysaccharide export system protein LptC